MDLKHAAHIGILVPTVDGLDLRDRPQCDKGFRLQRMLKVDELSVQRRTGSEFKDVDCDATCRAGRANDPNLVSHFSDSLGPIRVDQERRQLRPSELAESELNSSLQRPQT